MKNLLLLISLIVILPAEASIYKWTDEHGIAQFGDCPPAKCGSVKIDMEPLVILHSEPLSALLQEAPSAAGQRAETGTDVQIMEMSVGYPELGLNPPLTRDQCHSSPNTMHEPDWEKLLDPAIADKLDRATTRNLNSLLGSLGGEWTGDLNETRFLHRDDTFITDEKKIRVNARVKKAAPGFFVFDLELDGKSDNRTVRPEELWFSLGRNRVQSGDDRPNNHNDKQWDYRVINADGKSLEIVRSYRRHGVPGHSIHHLVYRSLLKRENAVSITDCLYVQGTIASSRQWTFVR